MSRIYLATSWRNPIHGAVLDQLVQAGHQVYDFKNPPNGVKGFAWSDVDPDYSEKWKADPAKYLDTLTTHPRCAQGFLNDMKGLKWCDTCVLLLPCGRSAHIEAGWACGAGKRVIIVISKTDFEPELMYLMSTHMTVTLDGLLEALK